VARPGPGLCSYANLQKLAEVAVICNGSTVVYDTDKMQYVKTGESTEAALKVPPPPP
jgi:hypothetical protein